jgi:hypothetical protein
VRWKDDASSNNSSRSGILYNGFSYATSAIFWYAANTATRIHDQWETTHIARYWT